MFTQNKQGLDEQHRLQAEKVALIDTVKKLNREVAKLESFKKSLLQHLQEDDEVRDANAVLFQTFIPRLYISEARAIILLAVSP